MKLTLAEHLRYHRCPMNERVERVTKDLDIRVASGTLAEAIIIENKWLKEINETFKKFNPFGMNSFRNETMSIDRVRMLLEENETLKKENKLMEEYFREKIGI